MARTGIAKAAGADDELPEDVIEEVEKAGEEGPEVEGEEAPPVEFKLSRRKKEQQEREDRMAELEARAAKAEEYRTQLEQTRIEQARLSATVEILAQQRQQPAQQQTGDSPEDQLKRHRKERDKALAGSDLDAYHEHSDAIRMIETRALLAQIPQQQPQQFQPQKPDWVRAVEFQYPDVMVNPNGQKYAAAFEAVIPGEFSPDKLHKMFQRARQELGTAAPAQGGHSNGSNSQRQQLFSSPGSNSVRGRSGGDDDSVKINRGEWNQYWDMASKAGMNKAQALKAWKESYGNGR